MTSRPTEKELMNQRTFPRVSTSCAVRYRRVETDSHDVDISDKGIVSNISGGGICFAASEPHDTGEMLALEVNLPGFPNAVISMGKVCWCRPEAGGGYEVGVEFWWVGWEDESAQAQIRQFITKALHEGGDADSSE